MNFDFQVMKDVLQRDFDAVLEHYPTDLSSLREIIPVGGDAYERKKCIIETAAEHCPVRLFGRYPFPFALDAGEVRNMIYRGLGNLCLQKSGVDFSPLSAFRELLKRNSLGPFNDYTDHLHRTLDHDKLLSVGFRGVYEECAALNRTESDPQKKRWRSLVMSACLAVRKIGLRLRALASEQLAAEENEDIRLNLQRIASSRNTPWEAPETFYDALTALLCAMDFITLLDGINVHCCGAFDRLMLPFYERDLAAGRITKEEAYYLIQCFLAKSDLHIHQSEGRTNFDSGVSLMIGGCDPDGKPVYNAITDMIIDAYRDNRLIHPKLNARAAADSPVPYLKRLSELILSGNNNLVIENDDYIIPMFLRMGLSVEDARTYAGNGCQEVICRHQLHSRAFVYLNTVQVLLDTIRFGGGETLPDDLQKIYRYGSFKTETYEELHASFLANLRSYIRAIAETFAPFEKIHSTINPEPMLSAFTADCISRGQDITEGGARYYHKTLALVGFGTLCDSLLSLRDAYNEGSIDALISAVSKNFAGEEALRRKLQSGPNRFGHSPEADRFAASLADELAQVSRGIRNGTGIEWRTSLFTYYQFKALGAMTGATPDGRLRGEPFSRQMNMASMPVLTAAAQSMAVLTEADFNDVGMFDFFLPYMDDSAQMADVLTDYIRTCLTLKIPVLQPNCADVRQLIEERDHKGTHPELVVRVCGYSAIFTYLERDKQDEIIARAQI